MEKRRNAASLKSVSANCRSASTPPEAGADVATRKLAEVDACVVPPVAGTVEALCWYPLEDVITVQESKLDYLETQWLDMKMSVKTTKRKQGNLRDSAKHHRIGYFSVEFVGSVRLSGRTGSS